MGLTKQTYTDNVTVITAENLNDIQDAIIALENTPAQGLTEDMKQALLQLARKVAYIDDQGQTYYDDLYNALYPPKTVVLITAVFEQGSTVIYDDTALDDLKQYLTVTAKYDDNTTAILADSAYTLSGLLEAGTSTVTVAYNGLTTTFTVNVTARPTLSSISAVYTQSGTVYDTDTLASLKADLVVTAHYSDSSTQTVPAADYTLSGTLTAGTSTITVSYGGKTTTFNVTVTSRYELFDYAYNTVYDFASGGWVDTGLTHSPSFNTLNIELEAMNTRNKTGSDPLICANNQNTSDTGNIVWYARANKGGFSAYNLGVAKQLNMVPGDTRAIIKYFFVDGGESYMEWNGNRVAVATMSKSSVAVNNKTLVLAGGWSFSNGAKYPMEVGTSKLGYVKFTDPDTNNLLYHFIPAHDLIEDKWGFYEVVNKIFYPATADTLRCANWEA